jgi:hypothetical protein
LLPRLNELRLKLNQANPVLLARYTGTIFIPLNEGQGKFEFTFWQQQVDLPFPGFTAYSRNNQDLLDNLRQGILLYYFAHANGIPETGHFIAFSELPDGRFYDQAFQGYTGQILLKTIGNNQLTLDRIAISNDGSRGNMGDIAYKFRILPRITVQLVFWDGDEDFPPVYKILFDKSIQHYLPTDACAVLGSLITRQLCASI